MLKNVDIALILAKDNTNCAYKLLMSNKKITFNQCLALNNNIVKLKIINHGLIKIYIYLWLIKTNFFIIFEKKECFEQN